MLDVLLQRRFVTGLTGNARLAVGVETKMMVVGTMKTLWTEGSAAM